MKVCLTRTMAWLLIVALFHSHVVSPVMAAPPWGTDPSVGGTVPLRPAGGLDEETTTSSLSSQTQAAEALLKTHSFESQAGASLPSIAPLAEDRLDEDALSGCACPCAATAAGAMGALSLAALMILYIINPGVGGLVVGPNPSITIPPVPPSLAGMTALTMACATPETVTSAWKMVKRCFRCCSKPPSEEEDTESTCSACSPLSFLKAFLALGAVGGIVGKNLYVLLNAMLPPYSDASIPFVVIGGMGIPFFVLTQIQQALTAFGHGWGSRPHKETPAEQELHAVLKAAFLKMEKDPDQAQQLMEAMDPLRVAHQDRLKALDDQIAALKAQGSRKNKGRIKTLKRQKERLGRTYDALTLWMLKEFVKDEVAAASPKAPPSFKARVRNLIFGGNHPWWDKMLQSVGLAGGGMASGAIYYSYWYILGQSTAASVFAGILAVPFTAYMMRSFADEVSATGRRMAGYNPIHGEAQVKSPSLGKRVLRTLLGFVDWGRRIPFAFASTMIAGIGMGTAGISWNVQLVTLIPYFLAMASSLPSVTQRGVSRASAKCCSSPGERAQHQLALKLEDLAAYVRGADPKELERLLAQIKADPKDWFGAVQVAVEKMGAGTASGASTPRDIPGAERLRLRGLRALQQELRLALSSPQPLPMDQEWHRKETPHLLLGVHPLVPMEPLGLQQSPDVRPRPGLMWPWKL